MALHKGFSGDLCGVFSTKYIDVRVGEVRFLLLLVSKSGRCQIELTYTNAMLLFYVNLEPKGTMFFRTITKPFDKTNHLRLHGCGAASSN